MNKYGIKLSTGSGEMVVSFSFRGFLRRNKLVLKVALLIIIVFFLLPKLLVLFLGELNQAPDIRNEPMLEKPLRVQCLPAPDLS